MYDLGSVFCGLRWRRQELIPGRLSSAITGKMLTRQCQQHPGHQPHPVIGQALLSPGQPLVSSISTSSSLVASGEPPGGPRFHSGHIDAYVHTIGSVRWRACYGDGGSYWSHSEAVIPLAGSSRLGCSAGRHPDPPDYILYLLQPCRHPRPGQHPG